MNKQASIVPSYGNNKGPVTRAKTAAMASQGRRLLPRPPLIPDKKQTKVRRTKRVTSEENNHTAPYVVSSQNKKRAVLKDVSNVCCESSYRNCVNPVKIQAKACTQQVRPENVKAKTRSDHKDLKYTPAMSSNFELHDDGNDRKCKKHVSESLFDRESSFTSANLDGAMLRETKMEGCVMDVKGILSADQDSSNCLGIHDIDLDISNPQMCSLYANDIYTNLRASELICRTSSTYMETLQREITQSMRGILIDWLVEVAEEYRLVPDTLYLSVYAIDSFLSENCIERQRLQLLGVTCMLIASKYEEICAPRVEEFCYITDNTYNKADVLKMEIEVLSHLDFRLSVPTIKTFLRRFLRAAQVSYSVPSLPLGYMANYLSELTLVEYSFVKFVPSVIAASAVFLARWTLDQSDQPWNCTLQHYTSYKALDLKSVVLQMHYLQQNSCNSPLSAVRDKYIQEKYERVACRVSPELPDSLFF
ncbi:cyclin-A2-1-like isoform X1 [Dendrobium catenatum]|uniref:Cyclin-A2-1 n=1 Tax=Dendrobium catenatum TaxID=906689 RepID=A0A2I0WQ20_9ASPA|nr:cyclin-A2-1-like isoform X1 [Dendrobium catenatum]PKU77760.1 Cyclin-A2-1 [Dendrobium catenatum]